MILNGQQLVWARFSPVSTPFLPGGEKKKSEVKPKSSFKSTENRAASSLGVGGHPVSYTHLTLPTPPYV